MLIAVQVISKILDTKDFSWITDARIKIDDKYFRGYEKEFNFISEHYKKYGNVPDVETFISEFNDFELLEVNESNESLIDILESEYKESIIAPIFNEGINLIKDHKIDDAFQYVISEYSRVRPEINETKDKGVIADIETRLNDYEYVNQNQSANFIPTGFAEIDNDIVGLQRGEEFVVIYARTNQGKSWVLEAICTHAVEQGYRVGYFSPEMSVKDIGYRFDTLHGNLSNSAMKYGKVTDDFNIDVYKQYGETLKDLTGELYVSTPKDFSRKVTVTKLREWVESRNLDMLAIDGITYLQDERFKKGDSKTISLTNISEDLMELSSEMGIPIVVVVQANRGGVVDKSSLDTPELENIRDSDGIAMNASKVYAVRQISTDGTVTLLIDNKKMRTGKVGQSYSYTWDIDVGKFEYIDKSSIDIGDDEYESPKKKSPTSGRKRRSNKEAEDDY